MQKAQVVINRDVCARVCSVNQLRLQAVNLGLDNTYITLLDAWLNDAIKLDTEEEVIAIYDEDYDEIIAARDNAMTLLCNTLKSTVELPPKTVIP